MANITLPFNPVSTAPDQAAAQAIKVAGNNLFQQMLHTYTNSYNTVWNNKAATPPQIIAALGTDAVKIFEASAGLATYLNTLGANVPVTYDTSKYTVNFAQDGSATVVSK